MHLLLLINGSKFCLVTEKILFYYYITKNTFFRQRNGIFFIYGRSTSGIEISTRKLNSLYFYSIQWKQEKILLNYFIKKDSHFFRALCLSDYKKTT